MTQRQIEAAKKAIQDEYYGDAARMPHAAKKPLTGEDEIALQELSCREMINSMLIYGDACEKGSCSWNQYLRPYCDDSSWRKGKLTESRLSELIAEQKEDIAKAEVGWCEKPDSEGGYYKYCRFADEEA